MVAVAEDRTRGGLRRRKLHGGSGISPLGAGDSVTGLYYERARWYSPSMGTWISQDPAGYINGADTYQFVGDRPVGLVDPWGLFDKGGPASTDPGAAQTRPIPEPWKWTKLPGGRWKGTRGVIQRLGTVITNGMSPSDWHLLKLIEEIMKFSQVGEGIIASVNHFLDSQDVAQVRFRYRITAAWTEHVIVCRKGDSWTASKKWVSGRTSRATEFGPQGGEILPGQREANTDVVKGAYEVVKEIKEFIGHGQ